MDFFLECSSKEDLVASYHIILIANNAFLRINTSSSRKDLVASCHIILIANNAFLRINMS